MKLSDFFLAVLLFILLSLDAGAQLDPIEKKYLLNYYSNNPACKDKYESIVKLVDNADPELMKKLTQCAQAVIAIRSADEIINSENLWFAVFFLRNYYADENKLKKYLLDLDTLYESISSPVELIDRQTGDKYYNTFVNMKITADKSLEHFIEDRKSGRLKYIQKTTRLKMEGVDLFEYYTILSSAYPNECSELENTINSSLNVPKDKITYTNYFQWYESMYMKYVHGLMKNTAENKKRYAENDMVFCDKMILAELDKSNQDGDNRQFTGPGWELVSLTFDPGSKSNNWLKISAGKVTAALKNSKFTMTISAIPKFIKDGERVKIEFSTAYDGTDDDVKMNLSFETSALDFQFEGEDYNLTVGKISSNKFERKNSSGIFWVKKMDGITASESKIYAQVFTSASNEGPYIFEAKYKRKE